MGWTQIFMNRIASDIGSGLLYLHERGIAHRDLKKANVLVSNHHYREEKNRDQIAYAWSHQPVICKLTDFGESRSKVVQSRSVCRSRTVNIDKGTIPYMAPEILLGSEISRAGDTVEDLLIVDMWAYGMLLYNLLNHCFHYPYEEVLRQEETGDKDKIIRFLRDGRRLSPSEKYAERCQPDWRDVCNEACAPFQPRDIPDARNPRQLLTSWER